MDWYLLLTPIALLAVVALFRFIGCGFSPSSADVYFDAVNADGPVAFFRLQEKPGDTVFKNQVGPPDGSNSSTVGPLDPGDPNWRSTAAPSPGIDLGITDPKLTQTDTSDQNTSIRFHGGSISVPANVPPLNNLTEFTIEVLVHPEWDVQFALGKYYCVLESADVLQNPNQPQNLQKNAGFGIYAGPDKFTDPTSPYVWQFWMGVGLDGFERLFPKPYTQSPGNPVPNPGPIVQHAPTYLAVTFSQSQNQAFIYVFTPDQDIDYTTYEMNPLPYVVASQELFIGITPMGPLFGPFQGPTLLYPFLGLIGEVAIYDKVLTEDQLRNHVMNAFFNI